MVGGEFRAHAELAVRMFSEGVESMGRGDVAWACAAFYKAVEETVKALAIAKGLEEAREALARDRWSMGLLDSAARRLGNTAWCAWVHGYFLYVEGFGEGT
ncbi:PaREP1 family protein [Vulcanisaeta sp. JCM 14467]|uniref:PaREP1 family protein n=1 Tax=Vulcanisaeta sp. JCM 14467 TaxID=1295370 RepID=UPI000ABE182D|nr:PaREP1 family protein [Vulcanisaeta sp. JCM 14467]